MSYTLFQTPGNVVGGGMFTPDEKAPDRVVNYFQVDSIEASAQKVTQFGGKTLGPKVEVPGHGWMQHVMDSEGNYIALWQGTGSK
jgi:predicted enzyme related to lactoylglutathione lyase